MEEQASSYLYHPDNRELYLELMNTNSEKECAHSRNILAMIDLTDRELETNSFGKHMMGCEICRKNFLRMKRTFNFIENEIPDMKVSRENQIEMEKELTLMMKSLRRKESRELTLKVSRVFHLLWAVVRDILSVIFSIRMAMVFVAMLMLGLLLGRFV